MPIKFRKPDGELLFDTDKIVYGLVKSAYLVPGEKWARYSLRALSADPNDGSSWIKGNDANGDQMYTITIVNAKSPLCFIVGKGALQGISISGANFTFIYSGGDASTKAYVFDLMADDIPGKPYVKTRNQAGAITFNSLQPALSIYAAIQAPAPPAPVNGIYFSAYSGGRWESISKRYPEGIIAHNVVDIALVSGIEYAVHLPYSRACGVSLTYNYTDSGTYLMNMSEGAYGRVGGISFMFGIAGATVWRTGNSTVSSPELSNLPVNPLPQALIITTAGLPFPFR